jgi:nicotinate phosphoribosyltransferase
MRNLTMMTDLYELTMLYGYHQNGLSGQRAVFTMFFREAPGLNYAVMAGNEQLAEYIAGLRFYDEDIDYLDSLKLFSGEFLDSLRGFRFTGSIDIIPEGSIVFPGEPLVRVDAPLAQAQFVETALLNIIGHQSLIATKGNRIARAAKGEHVMEFGLRRAQGPDAGNYGARAAFIGGCRSTSNVQAGQLFGIPISGTHAHSWVMSFDSELAAFRAYAKCFPTSCMLLVDTYDTLLSGVPNAITVFSELRDKGFKPRGIRLDSGDLAYLSREARRMLDEAGFNDVLICASNDLDEFIIRDLELQGARIDLWGVGTKLITSADRSAFGGVYKMCALEKNGTLEPKIKLSENPEKVTLPGRHALYRLYTTDGMAAADLIALDDEIIDPTLPLTLFDAKDTWKTMTLENFSVKALLTPLFKEGEMVAKARSLEEISAYRAAQEKSIWEQHLRLVNPHPFKVDLSKKLWNLRYQMLHDKRIPPE